MTQRTSTKDRKMFLLHFFLRNTTEKKRHVHPGQVARSSVNFTCPLSINAIGGCFMWFVLKWQHPVASRHH